MHGPIKPRWSLTRLLEDLFPQRCVVCGSKADSAVAICISCRKELPLVSRPCRQCGLPLPGNNQYCGHCLVHPPPFSQIIAPFRYQEPLSELITGLKFHGELQHAKLLASLLAEKICMTQAPWPELIIPVPLHPKRQRERGYNQALEIARPIGTALDIEVAPHIVTRHKETQMQSRLRLQERHKNLRNAFTLQRHQLPQHIALLDDVVTTSATVTELASTLKRAGVRQVDVWAVARAVLD